MAYGIAISATIAGEAAFLQGAAVQKVDNDTLLVPVPSHDPSEKLFRGACACEVLTTDSTNALEFE